MKMCRRCLTSKSFDKFHKSKNTKDGHSAYCKICKSQIDKDWINSNPEQIEKRKHRSKQWQKDNPEKYRKAVAEWKKNNLEQKWILDKKSHLWTHYRMTIDDFIEAFEKQSGKCKICNLSKKLTVDHDHSCCSRKLTCGKCVRGLICSSCNTMIGLANDDVVILKAAIKYLEDNK
jgi:hypothetical protein